MKSVTATVRCLPSRFIYLFDYFFIYPCRQHPRAILVSQATAPSPSARSPSICVHISNYVSQMCVRVAAGAVHFLGGPLMQVT